MYFQIALTEIDKFTATPSICSQSKFHLFLTQRIYTKVARMHKILIQSQKC